MLPLQAAPAAEEHFDTLIIGTQTYSNVTVTTRNNNYVFFLHSRGMMNIKVSELSPEEKQALGYESKKPATNSATAWAKATLKRIDNPQVQKLEKQLQTVQPREMAARFKPMMSVPIVAGACALVLGLYLFGCYCCMLICKKAGSEPGVLVWLPVVQMLPLLRAAKMSSLWFAATILPVLNIVAHVVWCVRISKARGKGIMTAILLILPITNIFAFLYLALADGSPEEEEEEGEVISLGTT